MWSRRHILWKPLRGSRRSLRQGRSAVADVRLKSIVRSGRAAIRRRGKGCALGGGRCCRRDGSWRCEDRFLSWSVLTGNGGLGFGWGFRACKRRRNSAGSGPWRATGGRGSTFVLRRTCRRCGGGDGEADTGCGWRTRRWEVCTRAAHELVLSFAHARRPQAPRRKNPLPVQGP